MAKLWEKDYGLHALIEKYTVGEDWKLDQKLLIADCLAGIAHAGMLREIGILQDQEYQDLEQELRKIIVAVEEGELSLQPSDEDGHTVIETILVQNLGETGKKIHTGRSRNDQVLAALRLYGREAVYQIGEAGLALCEAFSRLAAEHEKTPMPGRTHMQIAMPSSVGLWAAAFAEEICDDLYHLLRVAEHVDQSPLGSAASYGVPLSLDREMVAEALGFEHLQRNVLYVNNSRGKFESLILEALDQMMLSLSKAAMDLMIFSMPEFGYFHLPKELCSGSSIMPQKRNPDMLELIRAKSGTLSAYTHQVKQVIRSLPSGYNRDFQETKEPFLRGLSLTYDSLRVMELTVGSLEVDRDRLRKAMPREIFATDAALDLVRQGESFREAYRRIGLHPEEVPMMNAEELLSRRSSTGAPGNLRLDLVEEDVSKLRTTLAERRAKNDRRLWALAGREINAAEL